MVLGTSCALPSALTTVVTASRSAASCFSSIVASAWLRACSAMRAMAFHFSVRGPSTPSWCRE